MQCPMCGAEMLGVGTGADGSLEQVCRCGTKIALPVPQPGVASLEKRVTQLEDVLRSLKADADDRAGMVVGLVKRIETLEGGKVG